MSRLPAVLTIAIIALAVSGCDSEKSFEGAPSASAPEARATSPAKKADPATQRTDKPTTGEMPADHPPVGAAQGQGSADQGSMPAAPGGGQGKRDGTTGPLRWDAPEGWKAVEPASNMRYAEYLIEGGSTPLSLTIFYFGPNGGGSIQQNIDRWTGQFDTSSGSEPEVGQREVNGMTVHTVDAAGTYDAGAAMGGGAPKQGQRMLGAIVEAPTGNYFIKLVGPEGAVTQQTEKFESFISSFDAAK